MYLHRECTEHRVSHHDPRRAIWQTAVAHHWHYGGFMMRSIGFSLVAFASLAACTDTGAHLTLSAPGGPTNAKTFRVVLASPEQVPSIHNQRLAPGDPSTTDVQYYLQRTLAGNAMAMPSIVTRSNGGWSRSA
jgi:hypothetical protein